LKSAALKAAEKLIIEPALYQGTTLQAAEKLVQAVGRGFIPGIKPMESAVALATEVCFSDFCLKASLFSQPL
jgi:hypothetical protein